MSCRIVTVVVQRTPFHSATRDARTLCSVVVIIRHLHLLFVFYAGLLYVYAMFRLTAPSCGDGRGSCAAVFYDYARTLTTRRFLDQAVRVKRFHVCKTSSPSPQLSVHASLNLAAAAAAAQQLEADLLSDVLLVHSRPITGSSMI